MTQENKYGLNWSREYDEFRFLGYNRDVDTKRVNKIKAVIAEDGFLVPILVNVDGYVVDGQHRLSAVRDLGKEFSYVQYDIPTDKLPNIISKLNSTAKTWGLVNYMEMWAQLGKAQYMWMDELIKKQDILFTHFYRLVGNVVNKFGAKFRSGTVTFTEAQKEKIFKRAKEFNEIRYLEPRFKDFGTGFLNALAAIIITRGYDHGSMINAISTYPGSLLKCRTGSEYKGELIELYNRIAGPKNKM